MGNLKTLVISLAHDALLVLLPILAAMVAEWLRRKLGVERLRKVQKELETKQDLAALAVQFAEQALRDYKGEEKFDAAADWMVDRLADKGIKVSTAEITGLVEAALRAFKDEFGEQWASANR